MPSLKKLVFALLFLIVFALLIYSLSPIFKDYDFIFSLSIDYFLQIISLSILISLSSLLFILFASLALDWKFIVPVGVLTSILPVILLDHSIGIVFAVGILIILLLTYLSLESTMKSYLDFKPTTILGPSIRHLSGLLILIIAISYFLGISKIISEKGFQLPDKLIDTALKFTPQPEISESETTLQPSIPQEQLDLLRKNPELLRQSGLDPKILDNLGSSTKKALNTPQEFTNNLIKETVKTQVQNFINPYLSFIPAILALLLFITLQSLTSLVNILIYPLLWLIFRILEKTRFIKFEIEQRTVKKLVI